MSNGLLFDVWTNTQGKGWNDTDNNFGIFQTTPFFSGITTTINSNWSDFNVDNIPEWFNIRCSGFFYAKTSGTYTFTFTSNGVPNDDISNFYISSNALSPTETNYNNQTKWSSSSSDTTYSIDLVGGKNYPIAIYYGQIAGGRSFGLGITSPSDGIMTYDGTGYFYQTSYHPENNSDFVKDIMLQIKIVDNQISSVLCQYKSAIDEYKNNTSIKMSDQKYQKSPDDYSIFPGKTFWGTSSLDKNVNTSQTQKGDENQPGLIYNTWVNTQGKGWNYVEKHFNIFNSKSNYNGVVNSIDSNWNDFNVANNNDWINICCKGYFYAIKSGKYTFTFGSSNKSSNDDIGNFYIGDNALFPTETNFNNQHIYENKTSQTYSISLEAGKNYPIAIYFGQSWGGRVFGLGITPPNGTLTYDGTGYFYQTPYVKMNDDEVVKEDEGITQDECVNMCANNANCVGATYNSVKKQCWARAGQGELISSSNPGDVAILFASKPNIDTMTQLESQLKLLRQKKMDLLKQIGSPASLMNNEVPFDILNNSNQCYDNKLKYYNGEMDKQYNNKNIKTKIDTINTDYNNTTIQMESNMLIYSLWSFALFAFFVIVISIMYNFNVGLSVVGVILLFILWLIANFYGMIYSIIGFLCIIALLIFMKG